MPRDDRPVYVKCGPDEWAAAKTQFDRLQKDPAWAMQARWRTASVAAAMANGQHIDPLLALEFAVLIRSRNYVPRAVVTVEPKPMADSLGALSWPSDLPVPNAAPVSDHGEWLDKVTGPRRPGVPR